LAVNIAVTALLVFMVTEQVFPETLVQPDQEVKVDVGLVMAVSERVAP
jgi:hypothetical protein